MKNIYFIIIALLAIVYIIGDVRKKRFSIKESFWWIVASIVMLFLAIFPYSIDYFAKIFHVDYGPSLLFVFCIVFLTLMNFRNSKKIAEQQEKIIEMAEQIVLLKDKVNQQKK